MKATFTSGGSKAPAIASGDLLSLIVGLLICGAFSLALTLPAAADEFIYTYQGNPFTTYTNGYTCSPGPCEIQATFNFGTQIAAGLVDATVTPTDWNFSDNNGLDTSFSVCVPICGLLMTGINTDSLGDITSWNLAVGCFGSLEFTSSPTRDFTVSGCHASPIFPMASNADSPGTWSCTDVSATGATSPCGPAPPAQTPEGSSSLGLLGIGLLFVVAAAAGKRFSAAELLVGHAFKIS